LVPEKLSKQSKRGFLNSTRSRNLEIHFLKTAEHFHFDLNIPPWI